MKAFALGVTITTLSLVTFALAIDYAHIWFPYAFSAGVVSFFCFVSYRVGGFFLYEILGYRDADQIVAEAEANRQWEARRLAEEEHDKRCAIFLSEMKR